MTDCDSPSPPFTLFSEELVRVTNTLDGGLIFRQVTEDLRRKGLGLGSRHVKDGKLSPSQALLDLPFIGSISGLHDVRMILNV